MTIKEQLNQHRIRTITKQNEPKIIKDTEELKLVEDAADTLNIENLYKEINQDLFNNFGNIVITKDNTGEVQHYIDGTARDRIWISNTRGIRLPEDCTSRVHIVTNAIKTYDISASWKETRSRSIIDADGHVDGTSYYDVNCGIGITTYILNDKRDNLIKAVVKVHGKSLSLGNIQNWSLPEESDWVGFDKSDYKTLGVINLNENYLQKNISEEKKEEYKNLLLDACLVLGDILPLKEKKPKIFES